MFGDVGMFRSNQLIQQKCEESFKNDTLISHGSVENHPKLEKKVILETSHFPLNHDYGEEG